MAKAEISETDVTFKKEAFDYDDGIAVYDIEFIYGDKEYEFEINATDGTILDYSVESIWN